MYFSNFCLWGHFEGKWSGSHGKGLKVPLIKETKWLGTCLTQKREQETSGGSGPSVGEGYFWQRAVSHSWAPCTYVQNFTSSKERFLLENWWWIQTMLQSLWKMTALSSLNSVFLHICICCYPVNTWLRNAAAKWIHLLLIKWNHKASDDGAY